MTKKFQDQSQVEAFRAAMDDKDRLIHGLAANMLKTRYSIERSNGYKAFKEKEKAKAKEKA